MIKPLVEFAVSLLYVCALFTIVFGLYVLWMCALVGVPL